ncbi:O-antigen ligase family protein [Candidatus Saccharibacteria bacterium]|nr:O-antigen ligase family protein [Candidatus Saccharibacteria bacterium]
MKKLTKIYKGFLYVLPLALCFSYFPVISFGENETMNFELSLSLIWLALFDVLAFVMICQKYRARIFSKVFGNILWWLFPLFATFSVAWSLNPLRGILTVGVMWLLFFAVIGFWELKENLDTKFWKIFWRWFFGSFLLVCLWCVIQCVLDIVGVSQDITLLCDGCVYRMFGFPHPNGFSIEPQFMGNLLLAPIMVVAGFCQFSGRVAAARRHGGGALILALPRSGVPQIRQKTSFLLFFIFSATLFLTLSRGAIYACVVGLLFMFFFSYFRAEKTERKNVCFSILKTLGIFLVSFLFTLNLQGILAASSPTSDTYMDGVGKVLEQLSLGVIKIRGDEKVDNEVVVEKSHEPVENSSASGVKVGFAVGSGEKLDDDSASDVTEGAVFDGYVAESTNTRLRLAKAALEIWRKDFETALVGVGIGGAGQALYDNGLSPAPKEIVQNEYASLLLETGLIGVFLFVILVVMTVKTILKNREVSGMVLSLVVAYGVTLIFFSGIPNALQIVIMPGILVLVGKTDEYLGC